MKIQGEITGSNILFEPMEVTMKLSRIHVLAMGKTATVAALTVWLVSMLCLLKEKKAHPLSLSRARVFL